MNREIKFRALKKSGEWVYGFLIPKEILEDPDFLEPFWIATGFENECYPVDKKTVGQFTSLKDKNGVEIYEGDILKMWINDADSRYDISPFINTVVNHFGSFGYFDSDKEFHAFATHSAITKPVIEDAEIIGNIHENEDLIK